ncbi:MAG: hypothetical protein C0457_03630 [Polymorphum sp.]|uniref:hypothetical protein n=1 Tax=Pannonibacter phragmitetus TaxID=121719 RepID=UPI000B96527B|nr:hypothetical protein [Pannonibacter phragmitetus]MBA4204060.1 hypothetical protein [Polymorphum sp.]
MTKQELFSFVMTGLVPAICKPLICTDPRHKAEDDEGEAALVLPPLQKNIHSQAYNFSSCHDLIMASIP